jgi:hypothetical protein
MAKSFGRTAPTSSPAPTLPFGKPEGENLPIYFKSPPPLSTLFFQSASKSLKLSASINPSSPIDPKKLPDS